MHDFFSSKNSQNSHNSASIAWNKAKLNGRYTYYKVLCSCSLYTNSSLGGTAIPL